MEKYTLGALFSPKDVRDYQAVCTATPEEFPKEYTLWKPHTKNQGGTASCVAHSLSSVVEFFNHVQEGTDVSFSTAYIYGNRTNHTGAGMFTDDALKLLKKYGDCPESMFKGNNEVPKAIEEFKERLPLVMADAYPHRISKYFVAFGEANMKACLMQYGVLVIAVTWHVGTEVDKDGVLHLHPETKADGGHCMYIYGWNEIGWKVGNSWGTGWGNHGNCIIPYEEEIRSVYGVVDDIYTDTTKDKQIAELKGQIEELSTKNRELQKTIQDNANEMLKLSDEIADLSVKLFGLQTQNAQLEGENSDLQKTIDEVQADLTKHITQLDEIRRQMDEYKIKGEEYEAQIAEYQKTIQQLRIELVQIKEPFNTPLGQIVAKVLNWFLKIFNRSK